MRAPLPSPGDIFQGTEDLPVLTSSENSDSLYMQLFMYLSGTSVVHQTWWQITWRLGGLLISIGPPRTSAPGCQEPAFAVPQAHVVLRLGKFIFCSSKKETQQLYQVKRAPCVICTRCRLHPFENKWLGNMQLCPDSGKVVSCWS